MHHSTVLSISSVIYRLLRCEYDIFYLVAYQKHIYAILAILEALVESPVEDDIFRYQLHTRARKVSSCRRRDAVLRLMGIDPNEADEQVNEEEILMMVDAGSEKGAIDEQEKEFIQNVFEFDDLTAEEIAVHRTEVTILWMEDPMEEWEKTIHDSRHTLYPVCEGSPDNIIGILNAKDFFRLSDKSRESVLENTIKQPYFVPENVKADVLFRNMKEKKESKE